MEKKQKANMKNVIWGAILPNGKKIGGGNLDILYKKTKKIPAICDEHQEMFLDLIECNKCDVRID